MGLFFLNLQIYYLIITVCSPFINSKPVMLQFTIISNPLSIVIETYLMNIPWISHMQDDTAPYKLQNVRIVG